MVTEGQLRANYHRLQPLQGIVKPGPDALEVRPGLPWQGFRRQDYRPAPFADGEVIQLTLDLMPTSWVFRPGHRIRLSIAGADNPSFARHPALAEEGVEPPTWTVHLGDVSKVVLPVIPAAP